MAVNLLPLWLSWGGFPTAPAWDPKTTVVAPFYEQSRPTMDSAEQAIQMHVYRQSLGVIRLHVFYVSGGKNSLAFEKQFRPESCVKSRL
jgi:hypothetical protein